MLLTEQEKIRRAAERADAEIGFMVHAVVYVLVIALLVFVNYRAGGAWWVQWPALGWGIGVIGHAVGVFGRMPQALVRWRLRRIDRLRQDMKPTPAPQPPGPAT